MSIIPGTKVCNGLLPQENDVALISRFEKLTLRKWGLGYEQKKHWENYLKPEGLIQYIRELTQTSLELI